LVSRKFGTRFSCEGDEDDALDFQIKNPFHSHPAEEGYRHLSLEFIGSRGRSMLMAIAILMKK
jgi:hypothetical protein